MFLGVVHSDARKVLAGLIPQLPKRVHILCSGNFSTETTLRQNGYKGEITGCDISLYTCALGAALTRQPFSVTLNVDKFPQLAPMQDYLGTTEGVTACVAVAFDALAFDVSKGEYNQRMARTYSSHLRELVETTIKKVEQKRDIVRLDHYYAQDAWQRAKEIPEGDDDIVLSFPPTYSGDYAKMYKKLSEAFTWQVPEYKELTSGKEFAQAVIARPGPWLILAEEPKPDMLELLGKPFASIFRAGQKAVRMFSNRPMPQKLTRRHMGEAVPPKCPRLSDEDTITEKSVLSVAQLKIQEAYFIRQVYSSVKPIQGQADLGFGVFIDGKLFGIAMTREGKEGVQRGDVFYEPRQICFILSDLAIASERHGRLAKLVVSALCTIEFQQMIQRLLVQDVAMLYTMAYSEKPTSMKYRGVMDLYRRVHDAKKNQYALSLVKEMGRLTLADAFAQWYQKHYRIQTKPNPSTQN